MTQKLMQSRGLLSGGSEAVAENLNKALFLVSACAAFCAAAVQILYQIYCEDAYQDIHSPCDWRRVPWVDSLLVTVNDLLLKCIHIIALINNVYLLLHKKKSRRMLGFLAFSMDGAYLHTYGDSTIEHSYSVDDSTAAIEWSNSEDGRKENAWVMLYIFHNVLVLMQSFEMIFGHKRKIQDKRARSTSLRVKRITRASAAGLFPNKKKNNFSLARRVGRGSSKPSNSRIRQRKAA